MTLGRRDAAAGELERLDANGAAFTPHLRANFSEVRAEVHGAYGATTAALHECAVAARLARHTGDFELIAQTAFLDDRAGRHVQADDAVSNAKVGFLALGAGGLGGRAVGAPRRQCPSLRSHPLL